MQIKVVLSPIRQQDKYLLVPREGHAKDPKGLKRNTKIHRANQFNTEYFAW